jgi:hypothetical protein
MDACFYQVSVGYFFIVRHRLRRARHVAIRSHPSSSVAIIAIVTLITINDWGQPRASGRERTCRYERSGSVANGPVACQAPG